MRVLLSYFPFGRLDKWLPATWPELELGGLHNSLVDLVMLGKTPSLYVSSESRVAVMRSITCLFWQVYYRYSEFDADEVDAICSAWSMEYLPDGELDWLRVFVQIHASAALAVYLHKTEPTASERMHEAVDRVTRLSALLSAQSAYHEPGVYVSTHGQYALDTRSATRSLGTR
jgi:hypothetical protein